VMGFVLRQAQDDSAGRREKRGEMRPFDKRRMTVG